MSQEPHVSQGVHVHKAPPPRTLLSGRGRQAFLDERDTDGLQDEEDERHGTYGPREPDAPEQLREHDREDDAAHRGASDDDPDRYRAVFAEPVCGDDELLCACACARVHFDFDLSCVYPRNYCEVRECVACIDTRMRNG